MTAQTYRGGCQCGVVRYEVKADLSSPIACNCSRCGKLGQVLVFSPMEDFTLLSGEDSLTGYECNKQVIHHLFYKVGGIQSLARGRGPDGAAMAAINIRCIDGVDANELNPQKFDGRSR